MRLGLFAYRWPPDGKLTGPVHESPKKVGDPCGHDRYTELEVGVIDGHEVWRATPQD